jgi:hypothetical protein
MDCQYFERMGLFPAVKLQIFQLHSLANGSKVHAGRVNTGSVGPRKFFDEADQGGDRKIGVRNIAKEEKRDEAPGRP